MSHQYPELISNTKFHTNPSHVLQVQIAKKLYNEYKEWVGGLADGWPERGLTLVGCSQGWPACQGHQYQSQPAGTVRVRILFSLQPFSNIHV